MVTRTRTGHNQVECSLKRREKIIENMSFTHFSKIVWISDMSLFLNQPEFSCRCVKFLTYLKDICKRPASCLVFFSVGNGGAGAIAGKTPSVIIRLYMIGIVFPDRIVLFLVLKKILRMKILIWCEIGLLFLEQFDNREKWVSLGKTSMKSTCPKYLYLKALIFSKDCIGLIEAVHTSWNTTTMTNP